MKKYSITLFVIAWGAIGGIWGSYMYRQVVDSGVTPETKLVNTANAANKTLPMMVDRVTRLDTEVPGPGKRYTYVYTLVNMTKDQFSPQDWSRQKKILTAGYSTSSQMKDFRDDGIELHYLYRDKNGDVITEIVINPSEFR
jgi:hypothetical protein